MDANFDDEIVAEEVAVDEEIATSPDPDDSLVVDEDPAPDDDPADEAEVTDEADEDAEPVDEPVGPPPIDPSSTPDQQNARVAFENEVNAGADLFAAEAKAQFIDAALSGERIAIVRGDELDVLDTLREGNPETPDVGDHPIVV